MRLLRFVRPALSLATAIVGRFRPYIVLVLVVVLVLDSKRFTARTWLTSYETLELARNPCSAANVFRLLAWPRHLSPPPWPPFVTNGLLIRSSFLTAGNSLNSSNSRFSYS